MTHDTEWVLFSLGFKGQKVITSPPKKKKNDLAFTGHHSNQCTCQVKCRHQINCQKKVLVHLMQNANARWLTMHWNNKKMSTWWVKQYHNKTLSSAKLSETLLRSLKQAALRLYYYCSLYYWQTIYQAYVKL